MGEQPEQRVRSFEVAASTKVSRSTVSRALSGDPRVSPATRAKVLIAAERLGARSNLIARDLKNQRTGIVGVVMVDLENLFCTSYQVEPRLVRRGSSTASQLRR